MTNQFPMLLMTGRVENVFINPDSVDKETGEIREGRYKVQLICNSPLKNGQTRRELQTLTTDTPEVFERLDGQTIQLPVGAYSFGKTIGFYALKGCPPTLAPTAAPTPGQAAESPAESAPESPAETPKRSIFS